MSKLHLLLTLLGALSSNAAAYEQATHALLTSMAYDASLFSSSGGTADLISRTLGLNTFAPFGSDEQYFEGVHTAAGTPEFMRSSQLFEKRILANLFKSPASQTPAKVWLMYGAIREDDNPTEDPATPQDVAPGLRRPLHHFYDPA